MIRPPISQAAAWAGPRGSLLGFEQVLKILCAKYRHRLEIEQRRDAGETRERRGSVQDGMAGTLTVDDVAVGA
jgi:hypothetical protein